MFYDIENLHYRSLSCGVEYLEKKGDYQQANSLLKLLLSQTCYGSHHRGHWFDRLALNLDFHLGEQFQVCNINCGHFYSFILPCMINMKNEPPIIGVEKSSESEHTTQGTCNSRKCGLVHETTV